MPFDSNEVFNTEYLSNIATEFKNPNYFAEWFFPIIDGPPAGKVAIRERGSWFRNEAKVRAPGAPAVALNYTAGSVSYSTDEYSAKTAVTHQDRILMSYPGNNAANVVVSRTSFVADKIDLAKEYVILRAIVGTGTGWNSETNGYDVNGNWAASGSSTFIADIFSSINTIVKNCGQKPNKLAMDLGTFNQIKQTDSVKALLSGYAIPDITEAFLARYFGLDEVKVISSIYNTAVEKKDKTDWSSQYIFEQNSGKGSAFLFVDVPNPSLEYSGSGLQIRVPYENGQRREVRTWYDQDTRNDWIECSETVSIVQTAAFAGRLFADTIVS